MASLKWSEDALKDLDAIDRVIARRIVAKAKWLEDNFENVIPVGLRRDFKGLYKLRIGDYRATYSVHGDMIIVQAVGHRRDIYR